MLKIFLDGVNLDEIKQYSDVVDGITTNPSLMKKSGIKNYKDFALEILKFTDKPVSFEVISDNLDEMELQARIISSWGDNQVGENNIYVKIPITNTKGESTFPIVKKLSNDEIKLNITAITTEKQADYIIRALSYNSIISIFAGRIADTGRNPVPIIKRIRSILELRDIELLWASTREIYNIVQADQCECDIITITSDILKKLDWIDMGLDEVSLRTVKQFYSDAQGLTI